MKQTAENAVEKATEIKNTVSEAVGGFFDGLKSKLGYGGKTEPTENKAVEAVEAVEKAVESLESQAVEAVESPKAETDKVATVLEETKEKIGGFVSKATEFFSGGLSRLKDFAQNTTFGKLTVKVGEAVNQARQTARESAGSAGGAIPEPLESPKHVDAPTADKTGWTLGQTSKRFESGRGGAGTVSTGKGDAGGASYGTYQLASKTGTLQKFLNQSGYGSQFAGLRPGTAEFNAKWKEIAQNDPNFGNAQHEFIKNTHYDPAMKSLQANGIDLSARGRAVQDALWSTSVQFGAGSYKRGTGAAGIFKKALAGYDIDKLTDEEIINLVQDYKINNNERMFRSSSASVRTGTLKRAYAEKAELARLAREELKNPELRSAQAPTSAGVEAVANNPPVTPDLKTQTATVANPAPTAPQIPPAQQAEKPTSVQMPLGTQRDKTPQVVQIAGEVGQDLRERNIAHIVTGGLA